MDSQAIWAVIGTALTTGTAIVSIAVYASRTRAITESTAHTVRNIENWRLSILPRELNDNFARKGEMASELKAIHDLLARIEKRQESMATRLMTGGSGV